jgi:rhamnosyltransferase
MVLDAGYEAIVYDNTDEPVAGFENLVEYNNLKLFQNGQNAGLGKALNLLMRYAQEKAFAFALYFDQDTLFSLQSLRYIAMWLDEFYGQYDGFAAIRFSSEEHNEIVQLLRAAFARLMISSGSLFQLEALQKAGWHDENYFVEGVDYKFCLDAHHAGFRLGEVRHCPDIDHESLQPLEKSRMFGHEIIYRRYPMQRHLRFVGALLRLSGSALMRAELRYGFIFFRNIFTHLVAQSGYYLLGLFFGSKHEERNANSQKVES